MPPVEVKEILIAVAIAMVVICLFMIGCGVLLIYKICEMCHDSEDINEGIE